MNDKTAERATQPVAESITSIRLYKLSISVAKLFHVLHFHKKFHARAAIFLFLWSHYTVTYLCKKK